MATNRSFANMLNQKSGAKLLKEKEKTSPWSAMLKGKGK